MKKEQENVGRPASNDSHPGHVHISYSAHLCLRVECTHEHGGDVGRPASNDSHPGHVHIRHSAHLCLRVECTHEHGGNVGRLVSTIILNRSPNVLSTTN